ncbi:50S ribosomal protein L32 [Candidatus Dependentiae bacterium]|nr:50S ribosomal protein L32 [Candidatus Dependentiae bacterium]
MPVPKRKTSKRRRDQRSANKGIKPQIFTACSHCQEPINPHTVCMNCGHYKGKKIMVTKKERSAKRGQERQAVAQKLQAKYAQQEQKQTAENK